MGHLKISIKCLNPISYFLWTVIEKSEKYQIAELFEDQINPIYLQFHLFLSFILFKYHFLLSIKCLIENIELFIKNILYVSMWM